MYQFVVAKVVDVVVDEVVEGREAVELESVEKDVGQSGWKKEVGG